MGEQHPSGERVFAIRHSHIFVLCVSASLRLPFIGVPLLHRDGDDDGRGIRAGAGKIEAGNLDLRARIVVNAMVEMDGLSAGCGFPRGAGIGYGTGITRVTPIPQIFAIDNREFTRVSVHVVKHIGCDLRAGR